MKKDKNVGDAVRYTRNSELRAFKQDILEQTSRKAKHAVGEVRRLEVERRKIVDELNNCKNDQTYERLKVMDKENWDNLKKARSNVAEMVYDIFGEGLIELWRVCGY